MRFYDSEIKVLEVLWEHGELTAGQIAEILGKEDGWKRTTAYTVVQKCVDKGLARYKRNETDKILTKTMINNYTKAKIFPPPVKKKYSRTHLMLLIMIYHLKAILSIKDIGVLFHVALAEPDAEKQAQQIETIYAGFVALQKSTYAYLANMAENKADDSFYGKDIMLGCEDRELRRILLVLGLVIRANTEKQLAEHALDAYF